MNKNLMEKYLSKRVMRMKESQTMAISAKAKKMKSEGKNVVSLSAGEPDFPTPSIIGEAGIKAIQDGLTKYTVNRGTLELRKAVINKLQRDNQLKFTPEEIVISNGGKQAIANTILALCNTGDEVIIPAPYWVSFPEMVSLAGGTPVFVSSSISEKFKLSPSKLDEAVTSKTKLLILNTPSNPTGSVYTKREIEELLEVIKAKDILIISDEMYDQLIYDDATHFSPACLPYMREKVIVSNAVSKTFSMTGWRIGYIAAPSWVASACDKIQSQTTSNASSISQKAAEAALLADPSIIDEMKSEFRNRRNFIHDELNKINGIHASYPDGAFYIFPSIEDLLGKSFNGTRLTSSLDVANYLLDKYYLATVPGIAFGAEGYLRLSYAASMDSLQEALARIHKAFA